MHKVFLIPMAAFILLLLQGEHALLSHEFQPQDVKKLIQGRWCSIWGNAKSDKIDEKVCFQFAGDRLQIACKRGIQPTEGEFKIISSDKAGKGSIDFLVPANPEPAKGLYVLKDDTLILFFASAGEPRPREISAYLQKDQNILFYVLVREK